MITSLTTFVVGAGASQSYMLPTAGDLLGQARRLTPENDIYQLVRQATEIDPIELNEIIKDIRNHPAQSIDAFLESRQHLPRALEVGKSLMAALMGLAIERRRGKNDPVADGEDWMAYVIEKMRKGARTLQDFIDGNGGVRFVTFNFDTLIEDRLIRSLHAIYRGTPVVRAAVFERIPVIHVHGELLPVPEQFGSGTEANEVSWIQAAAPKINVVLDAIDESTKHRAQDAVLEAKTVCFLGFGYDVENLVRIGLIRRLKGMRKVPPRIFGSAWGLWEGERHIVSRYFHEKIDLAPRELKCRDALRYLDVFEE